MIMKLIHKTNFNIIDYTTEVSCKEYAMLSDAQFSEITSKFYETQDFDETGNVVFVDLKLIESVETQKIENQLFLNVASITFKNRDAEILKYENKKVNNSFFGFRYKVSVYDQKVFLEQNINFIKFDREVKSLERSGNAKIIENAVMFDSENKRFRTEQTVFIDYINVSEIEYIKSLKCISDTGEEINLVEVFDNSKR